MSTEDIIMSTPYRTGSGKNPFFGPLTDEQTILNGPWQSECFAWRYIGPEPGPSQPVDISMSAYEHGILLMKCGA